MDERTEARKMVKQGLGACPLSIIDLLRRIRRVFKRGIVLCKALLASAESIACL